MERRDEELLIEAVAGAWRPDDRRTVRAHPAWHDLDDAGRLEAFDAAIELRAIEAALDPDGITTTARSVLAKIRGPR